MYPWVKLARIKHALLAALCVPAAAGAQAPAFSVTPYEPKVYIRSAFLNEHGDIAGQWERQEPGHDYITVRGYLLRGGEFVDLGEGFRPTALNNNGEVAGRSFTYSYEAPSAYRYANGALGKLGTLGGPAAVANGINDAGTIVGYSSRTAWDYRAFAFRDGAMRELGGMEDVVSGAFDINNAGQIVGEYLDGSRHKRAFLYDDGVLTDIGTLGGNAASATRISSAGHVLGLSEDANGLTRNFVYFDGEMTLLPARQLPGEDWPFADDINSAGDAIGSGYLWTRGGMYRIADLVDPAAGWRITQTFSINDRGQISAHGCTALFACGPLLLTPVPEPAAAALLAAGLAVLLLAATRRRRAALRPLAAGAVLAAGSAWAGPPLPYYVTPLIAPGGGELRPGHMNERGQIAVTLQPAGGNAHAYVVTGNRWTDLGTLGGWTSGANDVNNLGHVVGYSQVAVSGSARAFLYRDGVMQDLGTLGGDFSAASALNDAGQVIGISRTADNDERAFFYSDGKMTPIGSLAAGREDSSAVDINASGQVTGTWGDNFGWTRTYIWQNGQMRDVGTLGGHWSEPTAINDAGDIAGRSETRFGAFLGYAWIGGVMREIGALPNDTGSGANDINNAGDVIGASWGSDEFSHPFLWRDGVLYDLNRYLMPGAGMRIDGVSDINDKGQILGSGCIDWQCVPVLLTPVPEPATAAMLALGLLMLAWYSPMLRPGPHAALTWRSVQPLRGLTALARARSHPAGDR